MAVVAGTRRAADAVHVILGHMRHVEIDDLRQFPDVEPARGDFGRNQRREFSSLEVSKCACPRSLTLVAVNRRGADSGALELL